MFSGLRLIALVLVVAVIFLLSNLSLENGEQADTGITMSVVSAATVEGEEDEAEEDDGDEEEEDEEDEEGEDEET